MDVGVGWWLDGKKRKEKVQNLRVCDNHVSHWLLSIRLPHQRYRRNIAAQQRQLLLLHDFLFRFCISYFHISLDLAVVSSGIIRQASGKRENFDIDSAKNALDDETKTNLNKTTVYYHESLRIFLVIPH